MRRTPVPTSGPDIRRTEVRRGSDVTSKWILYASRIHGEVCLRLAISEIDGTSQTEGCEYFLPVDMSELASGARVVFGPVSSQADVVVVRATDGRTWNFAATDSDFGFGFGFYAGYVPADARVVNVSAYDTHGRLLGEKRVDDPIGGR